MKKKIDLEKFYTPNEVVELGIMKAPETDSKKQMLLRYIREKKINAVNVGGDRKPRYLVRGKDLVEYMNAQLKPAQYITKGKFTHKVSL